jgi:hypothetical protein
MRSAFPPYVRLIVVRLVQQAPFGPVHCLG